MVFGPILLEHVSTLNKQQAKKIRRNLEPPVILYHSTLIPSSTSLSLFYNCDLLAMKNPGCHPPKKQTGPGDIAPGKRLTNNKIDSVIH